METGKIMKNTTSQITKERINGEALRLYKTERDKSLTWLSTTLGFSESYISVMLSQNNYLNSETVRKLEQLLNAPKYALRDNKSEIDYFEAINREKLSQLLKEKNITSLVLMKKIDTDKKMAGKRINYDEIPSDIVRKIENYFNVEEGYFSTSDEKCYTSQEPVEPTEHSTETRILMLDVDKLCRILSERDIAFNDFSELIGREASYVDKLISGTKTAGINTIRLMERMLALPKGSLSSRSNKDSTADFSAIDREIQFIKSEMHVFGNKLNTLKKEQEEISSTLEKLLEGQAAIIDAISPDVEFRGKSGKTHECLAKIGRELSEISKHTLKMKNDTESHLKEFDKELYSVITNVAKLERDSETNKRQLIKLTDTVTKQSTNTGGNKNADSCRSEQISAKDLLVSLLEKKNGIIAVDYAENLAHQNGITKSELQKASKELSLTESFSGHGRSRTNLWILKK